MKKHKMEFIALVLLLGTLCYAFYDCNVSSGEQNIVLTNRFLSVSKADSIENGKIESLSIPTDKLSKEEKETKKEDITEEIIEKVNESAENIIVVTKEENSIPYNEIVSNQVVNYALQFVGGPYVYGGNSLTNGTDCSGFTQIIYGTYGVSLPRSAPEQSFSGVSVGLSNIMPGDLVFSGYGGQICHVAIYIGDGKLVHALNENVGIVVTSLYIMPILDVRRVI